MLRHIRVYEDIQKCESAPKFTITVTFSEDEEGYLRLVSSPSNSVVKRLEGKHCLVTDCEDNELVYYCFSEYDKTMSFMLRYHATMSRVIKMVKSNIKHLNSAQNFKTLEEALTQQKYYILDDFFEGTRVVEDAIYYNTNINEYFILPTYFDNYIKILGEYDNRQDALNKLDELRREGIC